MARKKNAKYFLGLQLPNPTPLAASQFGFQPAPGFISVGSAITLAFDDALMPPEPKEEPKTVVGLTGYRLYTLDNELYLCGVQGNKQKGRESEQAQHNESLYDGGPQSPVSHSAPAWNCLCGFAAFFWPTSLGQPGWNGILAEVQAGGRTIYCEQGWRAERIVLNKLWIACPIFPESALEILRQRYEVSVEVL